MGTTSLSQLEDPNYPKNISKATIKGAPGSRKVSWQNDIHVTGTPERGDFPSQHSRALPEIPNASLSKENSDGKVDPVYQTASELAAGADGQFGEDTIEPPYAASNQFSLETPKTEFIIQDDVGSDEAGCQLGKVAPVYAKVSKKPKQGSSLNRPGPSTCPENVQDEEEPPPIPEKCFSDVSDDVVVSESPNSKTLVDTASDEASRDDWVSADSNINEDRCSVATHNGTTLGKLV
ncbi:uncharacterized protein LOC144504259 isoform X2 [Mustelus asterias]